MQDEARKKKRERGEKRSSLSGANSLSVLPQQGQKMMLMKRRAILSLPERKFGKSRFSASLDSPRKGSSEESSENEEKTGLCKRVSTLCLLVSLSTL